MKMSNWFFLFFTCVLLVGCGKKEIVGTEKILAQGRDVSPFTAVKVSGYYDVNITVGRPQTVVIKVNGNLLPYIESNVKSKTLTIQSKKGYLLRPQGIPEVDIVVSSLEEIDLSGNNNAILHNFSGAKLDLDFSGSNQFAAQGAVNSLAITASGNTAIDTQKLLANEVEIESNGNSKVIVSARDKLKISISGSSIINYAGDPKIHQSINGSGTISRIQETVNK